MAFRESGHTETYVNEGGTAGFQPVLEKIRGRLFILQKKREEIAIWMTVLPCMI